MTRKERNELAVELDRRAVAWAKHAIEGQGAIRALNAGSAANAANLFAAAAGLRG